MLPSKETSLNQFTNVSIPDPRSSAESTVDPYTVQALFGAQTLNK